MDLVEHDIIASFFDVNKTRQFFVEFREVLRESDNFIEANKLTHFQSFLRILERGGLLHSKQNCTDIDDVLLSILEIFCNKYSKIILVPNRSRSPDEFDLSYDTFAYLIKIYYLQIEGKCYFKVLIGNIFSFFNDLAIKLKNTYTNLDELESCHLYYASLRFLSKILKCIPDNDHSEYLCSSTLGIVDILPFPDNMTVKLFVGHIFPTIIRVSRLSLKDELLKSVWRTICVHFEDGKNKVASENNSCVYTLVCSLSDYVFDVNNQTSFCIHTEPIFWDIILAGLISSFPFTRKKALNVLKMFLSWVNKNESRHDSSIFFIKPVEDMKVWYDLVILFESLEEKQVHVIKPVLPKFIRILSLASKETYDESSFEKFKWSSSWVLALINRMLMHETRFVTRWAISTVLSLDWKTYSFNEQHSEVLVKLLLAAINDQSLYSRNNEQENFSLFLSSEKIRDFFHNYISTLDCPTIKGHFLKNLLGTITSQSWCVVALLHLMHALTKLESIPAWDQADIVKIRKVIINSQMNQELVCRSVLECFLLECCTHFLDWDRMRFQDVAELLAIFTSLPALHSSGAWNRLAVKLTAVLSSSPTLTLDTAHGFCLECVQKVIEITPGETDDVDELEIEKAARVLKILADASVIAIGDTAAEALTWTSLLSPVVSTVQYASKRPYMHNKKFMSALKLLTLLIDGKNGNGLDLNAHTLEVIKCLQDGEEIVEIMFQKLFTEAENGFFISKNRILLDSFFVLSAEPELQELFINIVPKLCKKILALLDDTKHRRTFLFPLWKILNNLMVDSFQAEDTLIVYESNSYTLASINYAVLLKVTSEGILQECISKLPNLSYIEKEEWLHICNKSACNFWDVCSLVVDHLPSSHLSNVILPLAKEAQEMLTNGPQLAVSHVIGCMRNILPKLGAQTLGQIFALLDTSWQVCLDFRGNEFFRPSLNSLIQTIFQTEFLHDSFFSILQKYFDRFCQLSESTAGLFYSVMKQFCKSFPIEKLVSFDCIPMLVYALTFGPIHQKSHKIMEETLVYFTEQDKDLANCLILTDSNKPSCCVRVLLIEYLIRKSNKKSAAYEEFLFALINALLKVDIDADGRYSSHFSNSYSHRLRNRAWQAISILQPNVIDQSLSRTIFLKALDTLGSENQQPSIRYFQEWVIFNIIRLHRNLLDEYLLLFEQSLDKRPNFIISILSITNLLIMYRFVVYEVEIKRCFKLITVLCMAQNFTVRLYAQVTLNSLLSLCREKNLGSEILQYEFVIQLLDMQTALSAQGNFFKNVGKLSNDFYFSSFNPISNFTLETILYELPRLSNVAPDEWIKPTLFTKPCLSIQINNADDSLKNSCKTSWSTKYVSDANASNSLDYNFQKKIIPVKHFMESDESGVDKKSHKGGLIVVASLIDRIPNLGGLCRTCEVFGVSEFVIGCNGYTEDKQFQNLAVSADKWVSIKEVKPHHLKEYLTSMKEKGYVLVGAEQTEDSCNLIKYNFPIKSILLLGHEKEGLPVDLIQLLDACVEIPQQGVVRSLNVHVSGAILIWEYARQHNGSS